MLGFPVTTRMTWNVFGRPGIPILTFILTESKKQGGKDVRHIVCAKPIQFWFKMSSSTWIFHLSGDIFWNKVMKHDIAPGYYPNPSNDFVYSGGSLASRFLKRRNGSYHPQLQSFPAPIRGLTGHLHLLAILTWTKLEAQSRSRWILVIFHYWSSSHICRHICLWICVDRTNADPMPWTIGFLVVCNMSKMQGFFHKTWTKHWPQYLGTWPRGKKLIRAIWYVSSSRMSQSNPQKKMQRWAGWTFWPWH